jgi:hypothetical protein
MGELPGRLREICKWLWSNGDEELSLENEALLMRLFVGCFFALIALLVLIAALTAT